MIEQRRELAEVSEAYEEQSEHNQHNNVRSCDHEQRRLPSRKPPLLQSNGEQDEDDEKYWSDESDHKPLHSLQAAVMLVMLESAKGGYRTPACDGQARQQR